VTASNLTIRNGSVADNGGGIKVDSSGSLSLSSSTISGNTATSVTDDGGGIQAAGNSNLTNVTISGNSAGRRGGGFSCTAVCTLTNVTISANTATLNGNGIHQGGGGGTSITFLNTIVANNGADECDGAPPGLISNGNNLSSDASCEFTSAGDQENTDPLLGPLQDNTGPTFTHALPGGSPAIDAGTNIGCPATDQRGVARPIGSSCDVGAYEAALVLTLIKRAFLPDGTPIPTGSTIPGFIECKYLIYINNKDVATSDVSVRDVLDPAFQYQAGTIQVNNSVAECTLAVCTAAEELGIFTAVDGAGFLTDAIDGDVASITGGTIDAGNQNVANLQLDINANAVWAILFSVKMP
jgi:predicted outer membrane repeat protein